jgi:predicted phosphate transport protein (TIGR00153 family)
MFRRLLPREVCFFDYFEQIADMIIEACDTFHKLMQGGVDNALLAASIKDIEHKADDLTHKCIEEINKTFITPIDRTDIHALIKRLDDIIDSVDACTSRVMLYEIKDMRHEAAQLAEVMVKSAHELEVALKGLRNPKKAKEIEKHLIMVHQLENDGDTILRAALTRLFKEEENAVQIIKWKEIFERLEKATDRCEEVANIIEKIVIEAS